MIFKKHLFILGSVLLLNFNISTNAFALPPGAVECKPLTTSTGYFTAYFEEVALGNKQGYDDRTAVGAKTKGQIRREAACGILVEFAQLLNLEGTHSKPEILFEQNPANTGGSLPPNALAAASSYFYSSGTATDNGDLYRNIMTGQDPVPGLGNVDAFVITNFYGTLAWDIDSTLNASTYNFHSIITHEIMHALGFRSLISPVIGQTNVPARHGTFDLNLFADSTLAAPFFNLTTENLQVATGAPPASFVSNKLVYRGTLNKPGATPDGIRPVYSPSSWEQGSSLSHFDITRATAGEVYIMNPSIGTNTVRNIHTEEKEVLCHMGYAVTGMTGCTLFSPISKDDYASFSSEQSTCIQPLVNDMSFNSGSVLTINSLILKSIQPGDVLTYYTNSGCAGTVLTAVKGSKSIKLTPSSVSNSRILSYTALDSISGRISLPATINLLNNKPGWPVQISNPSGYVVKFLNTADINGDGAKDLLVAHNDKVYIYDHSGNLLSGWPQSTSSLTYPEAVTSGDCPVVGDLTGDGIPEIGCGNNANEFFVWQRDGTLLPGWPKTFSGALSGLAITDINGDCQNEIIGTGLYGKLYVIDRNGNNLPGWPIIIGGSGYPIAAYSVAAVGDLNHDGQKEIVVMKEYSSDGMNLFVYSSKGTLLPGWPKQLSSIPYGLEGGIELGDLDGDGMPEIIVSTSGENKIFAFHADGTAVTGWPQTTPAAVWAPALGDLDGDGKLEVVAGTDATKGTNRTARLYAWHGNGTLLAGWPVERTFTNVTSPSFFDFSSPAIADVDNDQHPDVIASGAVSANAFAVHAFKADGTEIPGFPKSTINYMSYPTNTPTIADLDGDGFMELAAVDFDKRIYVWDLISSASSPAPWPMYQHDPQHTASTVNGAPTSCPAPRLNIINGKVYSDANNNTVVDSSEFGLAGIQVGLFKPGQSTPLVTVTTSNVPNLGQYQFSNLLDGNYYVALVDESLFSIITQPAISNGLVTGHSRVYTAAVQSGQTVSAKNFGVGLKTGATMDISVNNTADMDSQGFVYYTINLTNLSTNAAHNIIASNILPAGVTYVSHTIIGGTSPTYTPSTGAINIATLNAGAVATLIIKTKLADCGAVTDTTTFKSAAETDTNAANNSSSASFSTSCTTDLSIVKTVDTSTLAQGFVTYTIKYSNIGPKPASGIVASDVLPAGLTYVSHSITGGTSPTYTPSTGVVNIANIAPGAVTTLTIKTNVTGCGTITNTATWKSFNFNDSNLANNTSSVAFTKTCSVDISVVKTVDTSTLAQGFVNYTIQVTNLSKNAAHNILASDILPAGTTYVSHTITGGTSPAYAPSTGSINIPTLNAAAITTLTIKANVTGCGSITNTATFKSATETDTNAANNTSSAALTKNCDTVPPTTPGEPGAPHLNIGEIRLNWIASTDTGSGIAYYEIYRSSNYGANFVLAGTSTTNAYIDKGLSPGGQFVYKVRCKDNAGNFSAFSANSDPFLLR